MHSNLAKRNHKPELPKHLELFRILYNNLDIVPIGPQYLGNYEFEEQRLSSEAIQFIKDERSNFTVTQMAMQIASVYGVFVRAESVAFYYYKDKEAKLWQVNRSEYIKSFEKRNNVLRNKNTKRIGIKSPQDFYKSFIVWCIENGYEYFQVAKVLGYCPGTVRRWANEWGYKEYTMVRSKQPDFTGKVNRVDRSSEQSDLFSKQEIDNWRDKKIAEVIANEATHIPERHELKLPREVKDSKRRVTTMQQDLEVGTISVNEYIRQKEQETASYGSYIRQALASGHKVTITIEPIQNVKAS